MNEPRWTGWTLTAHYEDGTTENVITVEYAQPAAIQAESWPTLPGTSDVITVVQLRQVDDQ